MRKQYYLKYEFGANTLLSGAKTISIWSLKIQKIGADTLLIGAKTISIWSLKIQTIGADTLLIGAKMKLFGAENFGANRLFFGAKTYFIPHFHQQ